MKNIHIHLPEEVADSLHMPDETLNALAQEALLVRLYAMGKMDRDSLANALGVTFFELIFVLKKYGITLPDPQPVNGDDAQASPENGEDPRSEREKILSVLREAGLLVDPNEYPLLKQFVAEGPIPTLEEVHAIFARNPGKSLSEIVIEQRGPLY